MLMLVYHHFHIRHNWFLFGVHLPKLMSVVVDSIVFSELSLKAESLRAKITLISVLRGWRNYQILINENVFTSFYLADMYSCVLQKIIRLRVTSLTEVAFVRSFAKKLKENNLYFGRSKINSLFTLYVSSYVALHDLTSWNAFHKLRTVKAKKNRTFD